MTLTEITDRVMERLNLSSGTARSRVKRDVRERYQWVLGEMGLTPSTQALVTSNSTPDSNTVTFVSVQKLLMVFNASGTLMKEVTLAMLENTAAGTEPPTSYAIFSVNQSMVTIQMNCTATTIFTLTASALVDVQPEDMGDDDEPAFPSLFHDVLVAGAMEIELLKMEKETLASVQRKNMETRLAQLSAFVGATP